MRITNKFISEIFLVTLAVNIRANKRRLGLFIFREFKSKDVFERCTSTRAELKS